MVFDSEAYYYDSKIMIIWFPTLHFLPLGNTMKAKSNFCIQTLKSVSEMRSRGGKNLSAYTQKLEKASFSSPKRKKKNFTLWAHGSLIET